MIGRRPLLLSALAPCFVRHARAADVPRFGLGVASGQPQPQSLVLWTRLTGPDLPPQVPVHWELAHDEQFSRIAASGVESADAAWAHSVHAEPAGLAPARWYWYRFRALGQASAVGRTRTAPAADAPATLHAAIASCQRWDHGHYAAWRQLAAQPPDLLLFLGDYIYEYASRPDALRRHEGLMVRTLADYRRRYAQYKSDPALQAAHAACPWLLTWDDHELENDYAGSAPATPSGADMRSQRAAAYQAWWEHQPVAKALRPQGAEMRIFGQLDWGRLARIHLLDGRQYRHVQACPPPLRASGARRIAAADCPELQDPARSLLGAEQERWLAQGWDLNRPWNLLAQQTLMAPIDADNSGRVWTDGWDGYAPARQRLLATVAERRVPGAVVLGGDVHAHLVADLHAEPGNARSPVVASEFCGSSISSQGRAQALLATAMARNPHLHYGRADQRGYMAFKIDARQLQAQVMVVQRPEDPNSPVLEAARFVVDPQRPGPQRD
ncbi:MAG: alkaline phosphatase D family protein [Rubrivivax sp.]|nr:alkaline phosphatase D family protein [Rubrivivax sp.]